MELVLLSSPNITAANIRYGVPEGKSFGGQQMVLQ